MEIDVCPRWLLRWLRLSESVQVDAAIWFSTVLVLVASPLMALVPHVCLMRELLRIPCPGCGVLHAFGALVHLQPIRAWQFNPGAIAIAALFIFQLTARPVAVFSTSCRAAVHRVSHAMSNFAVAFLLGVWIFRLFN